MYREISGCRICGNSDLVSVLDLGPMALTGVFPDRADRVVDRVPLELVKCRDAGRWDACGLVQLRHSVEPTLLYGEDYGYRSGLNQWMVEHLEGIGRRLKRMVRLRPGDVILDIGSNDGTLLRALDEPGVQLMGMDPVGGKFRRFYPDRAHVIPDFFSSSRYLNESGGRRAKIVTSVAMFYDLEHPLEFMRQVCDVLHDDGLWLFEQSYVPAMLANTSYDTVCHEHLEYYAMKQIAWVAREVGLRVLDVSFSRANGGSFAVLAAKTDSVYAENAGHVASVLRKEHSLGVDEEEAFHSFRERVFRHREELTGLLRRMRERGQRVFGYGASTKGNVVLQFCGVTPKDLPCIAEVNPDKFGRFTPGTRIPIVSEEVARGRRPHAFLVLPWHFRETILAREAEYLSADGALIFPLPAIRVYRKGNATSAEEVERAD